MGIFENIKMALISILDNKLRSFLTMISIIIGIASVIAIVSIGRGATSNLMGSVLEITNGQMVITYKDEPVAEEDENPFMIQMTDSDTENIYVPNQIEALRNIPGVQDVVLSNSAVNITASHLDKEVKGQQLATLFNPDLLLKNAKIVQGRMFTETEFSKGIPVMLIHQKSAKKFFGEESAVGKEIIINDKIFSIIGTYTENALTGGGAASAVQTFYIPYEAWVSYSGKQEIQQLSIIPEPGEDLKKLGTRVEEALDRYKETTGIYEVMNFDAILNQMETLLNTMTMFVTMIAAISLVVGGIGVMNIMYVSVVERTHEIGLRKALGANGSQILLQFLIESVTITTLGGVIGLILGLLGHLAGSALVDYSFIIYPDVILIGVLFSMGVGLLFGTLPAVKAAKMPPIEALRSL